MNEEIMKKVLTSQARTILMAARCEFIEGSLVLTEKGKGWLTPAQWRVWNRFICWISPRRKADMLQFLEAIYKQKQRSDLIAEGRSAELVENRERGWNE